MVDRYGELVRQARDAKNISAKQLSEKLKKLLASKQFPETLFDDLAAADNEDTRIVAEDLAKMIRNKPEVRALLRTLNKKKLSTSQIKKLTASIGGNGNATE